MEKKMPKRSLNSFIVRFARIVSQMLNAPCVWIDICVVQFPTDPNQNKSVCCLFECIFCRTNVQVSKPKRFYIRFDRNVKITYSIEISNVLFQSLLSCPYISNSRICIVTAITSLFFMSANEWKENLRKVLQVELRLNLF